MTATAARPEDDALAIERMLDDGGPVYGSVTARKRMSRWSAFTLAEEPPAEERAAQRRAARRVFRLYCIACGRSSEMLIAPAKAGRCVHCGGTMLLEVAPD
jgi:hypothetical protein